MISAQDISSRHDIMKRKERVHIVPKKLTISIFLPSIEYSVPAQFEEKRQQISTLIYFDANTSIQ